MIQYKVEQNKYWNEQAAKECPDWGGLDAHIYSDLGEDLTFISLGLPKGDTDITQQQKDWLKLHNNEIEEALIYIKEALIYLRKSKFHYVDDVACKEYQKAFNIMDKLRRRFCKETNVINS